MTNTKNEVILIAFVPEALKDKVVDVLASDELLSGFSLTKIQGFSRLHSQYSVAEQVEGYQDYYRFEVLHESAHTASLLDLISTISVAKSIRYWLLPVIETGLL